MSIITDILATDSPSSSIGAINQNFDNLNADKIEAADVRTLTNKTIDADNNTITDLTPTNIKSGNKTGLDTFIVTGTKGSTNELAKWNADGDLVTAGVSITTTAPASGALDTTIPTSKAVIDAIDANLGNAKQVFVPAIYFSATATQNPNQALLGQYPFTSLNSTQIAGFNFVVPANFTTLVSAELVMIPDTTETITISDVSVDSCGTGELYTANTVSTGSFTEAVTINLITKVRLDTRTNTPFVGMTAGDVVGTKVTSGTTLIRIIGLLIKYT